MPSVQASVCRLLLPLQAVILLITATGAMPVWAQAWQLEKSFPDAGIQVWYRPHADNPKLMEYRGEITLSHNIEDIVGIITDVPGFADWVYQIEQARVVQPVDAHADYIHMIMASPVFFLEDRDSYLLSRLTRDEATGQVTMLGTVMPDYGPIEKEYTRIKSGRALWTLTPRDGGKQVQVIFEGYGDPGGIITAFGFRFILRHLLWRLPYETLLGLRDKLDSSRP
jgi:hypothetical protein